MHKYDLTPDCTHLIVGEYDTPKYRHVAKERPDIRPMAVGWVEAVRNLWVQDADIDFDALEREWQLRTFETGGGEPTGDDGAVADRRRLLCCMTGFEDPDLRQQIASRIESNGGAYTGDLTKRVTHLIVHKPEGRKYQAAKNWGVQTVSLEWVDDSIERGMILDEKCYDPVLPKEERGVGAWNRQKPQRASSLGKRLRENSAVQEEGRRKLRKTASMKLNSQRDTLWGDILGKPQTSESSSVGTPSAAPVKPSAAQPTQPTQPLGGPKSMDTQGSKLSSFGVPNHSAIFASCCFFVHGFSAQKTDILVNAVASLGGLVCHSVDEVVSTSGAQMAHRFLIVPQTSVVETHPRLPDNVHIITEFYIERCLHKKYFFDPSQHVIGRPFPTFPIPGFERLTICTAGFAGVDLNQVDKSIRQLGARYQERFTADASVLVVCSSLSGVRKEKLESALAWKVPVVSAEWLWECISTGCNVPIKRFMFAELRQSIDSPKLPAGRRSDNGKAKQDRAATKDLIDKDLPRTQPGKPKSHHNAGETTSAPVKEPEPPTRREPHAAEHESNLTTSMHFETALTHQFQAESINNPSTNTSNKNRAEPLSETSSNLLNKFPPSPSRSPSQPQPRVHKPLSRITSEVADSEATEGDVCQPSDLPAEEEEENSENHQPQPQEPDPEPTREDEKTRLRLEAEKAARATAEAEAERLAISTKLVNSLLDSAVRDGGGGGGLGFPSSMLAGTTTNDAGGGGGGGDDAAAAAVARPRRRKREILGRAVSNASAISTASSASGSGGYGAETTTPLPTTTAIAINSNGNGNGNGSSNKPMMTDHAEEERPPPATQLEYEDPEARRYKAQLMSKMLGKDNKGGSLFTTATAGEGRGREKLSLAQMGGYDLPRIQQQLDGYAAATRGGETRRTRRR